MPRPEAKFSEFVKFTLENLLSEANLGFNKDLFIAENKTILTDLTCVHGEQGFNLVAGFSETDIAIFRVKQHKHVTDTDLIRFYGDRAIRDGAFAIPFVILELKTGRLTTDGIRSRDFVAARIKSIFPFSAYYLIAEETSKEQMTLLRQGKSFTNYFISNKTMDRKKITDIFHGYIEPFIKNIRNQFD